MLKLSGHDRDDGPRSEVIQVIAMSHHTVTIGIMAFLAVFGGVLAGMLVRGLLPDHHRSKETEDAIKLGMGVIATMSALVIGLLIASAKNWFDTKDGEVNQLSSDMILLDRQMAHYGPQTKDARELLRQYVVYKITTTWPQEAAQPATNPDGWRLLEDVQGRLRALTPENDAQRWLRTSALDISGNLARVRWLLRVQTAAPLPQPFVLVLVLWLTLIYASFGLFAPRNTTALVALGVSSLSIAGAIFLILEMADPFVGPIHVSSVPMHEALAMLGQ
jgi:hypothetical protein